MKKQLAITFIVLILLHSLSGCATLLKGSQSEIILYKAPVDLTVTTIEGREIPISRIETNFGYEKAIYLKSSHDHILILKSGGNEKKYFVEGKVDWIS